jgi:probable rRNA maturation factor
LRGKLLKVLIQNNQKGKAGLKTISGLARAVLKDLGCRDNAELSILLTDNDGIQRLNKKYLKKDKPTDVLSFPMYEKDGKRGVGGRGWKKISPHPTSHIPHPIILGDVVISVETAKAQIKENGVTLDQELARLLIHGILHLLGFDHAKNSKEARRMRKEEERLLKNNVIVAKSQSVKKL